MKRYKRIFTIVIDSLGIGEMPDSSLYGDKGVNTFNHIWESRGGLHIPNLRYLGLGNLTGVTQDEAMGYGIKLGEASIGKDTMTGHWEMMGLRITKPFITFTETGFPEDLLKELSKRCGRKIVGNKSASGTEILEEYGEHEIATGDMIVYTSADSVMQICGNEETMGLENLYRYCEIARELTMKDEWKVGRVIARPYVGRKKGEFKRTSNRHDYALKPYGRTALNALKDCGYHVAAVGKINDIFDGEGITKTYKSISSVHGMEQTLEIMNEDFTGLCFVNLVDFDALWGHRRDPKGYGEELEKFDINLGELLKKMTKEDLLLITADHGNDPTYKGTDHTREYVPLLAYSPAMEGKRILPCADTFAVIGATILDNFQIEKPEGTIGESILDKLQ
jgi:phosphopentomutase